jgi:hypothetical protein
MFIHCTLCTYVVCPCITCISVWAKTAVNSYSRIICNSSPIENVHVRRPYKAVIWTFVCMFVLNAWKSSWRRRKRKHKVPVRMYEYNRNVSWSPRGRSTYIDVSWLTHCGSSEVFWLPHGGCMGVSLFHVTEVRVSLLPSSGSTYLSCLSLTGSAHLQYIPNPAYHLKEGKFQKKKTHWCLPNAYIYLSLEL